MASRRGEVKFAAGNLAFKVKELRNFLERALGKEDGEKAMQEVLANAGLKEVSKQPSHTVGGALPPEAKSEAAGKHLPV